MFDESAVATILSAWLRFRMPRSTRLSVTVSTWKTNPACDDQVLSSSIRSSTLQPPPTFLFCTVVSMSPMVTVLFGSDVTQPTFTAVRETSDVPSA